MLAVPPRRVRAITDMHEQVVEAELSFLRRHLLDLSRIARRDAGVADISASASEIERRETSSGVRNCAVDGDHRDLAVPFDGRQIGLDHGICTAEDLRASRAPGGSADSPSGQFCARSGRTRPCGRTVAQPRVGTSRQG